LDKDLIETKGEPLTAVTVGLAHREQPVEKLDEYMQELEFLATTAKISTKKRFTQKLDTPNTHTFIGSGKVNEIRSYVKDNDIDLVIFDDELSPSQMRNLEKELKRKIYDRNLLILDIFQMRAQTSQAKTQNMSICFPDLQDSGPTSSGSVVEREQEVELVKRKLKRIGELYAIKSLYSKRSLRRLTSRCVYSVKIGSA
jgi:hypothetical protein